jgi:hypothetical protein
VYIAFKYTSTTDGAATWEVDNVVVTGDETIGIAEEQFTADMKLYPNPSDGRITITSSAIDNAEYNVFSVTDELVSQGTLKSNHNTVDLSSLNGGIYTVQIVEDGKTAVKRIIIR